MTKFGEITEPKTIGTGFDPSTITDSLKETLKTDLSDKISFPGCNLHLYIRSSEKPMAWSKWGWGGHMIRFPY